MILNPTDVLAQPGYLRPGFRLGTFISINIGVLILMGLAATLSTPTNPRFIYVILLTALCASPVLSLERVNGPYFLLAAYLALYFNFFGFGDLMSALVGRTPEGPDTVLTTSEAVILVAGLTFTLGYHAAVKWISGTQRRKVERDWPLIYALGIGLLLWVLGTICLAYWAIYIVGDRTNMSVSKNLNNLGSGLTTVVMMGQLVQPLGVLILAYAYAKYKRMYLLGLIVTVVLVQIVMGFVADYKTEAMEAGILVIITKIYVDGKAPKAWLLGGGLFILLAFPVFQAYRLHVRGEQGVTAIQTLQNLVGSVQSSLQAQERVNSGFGGAEYRVQAFWERATLKGSVELLVSRVGKDAPFQLGATLTPIATAFVPKILWQDKPSIAVGQLLNKTFHITAVEDTFISPSHVGELYWNFGWYGIVLIQPLIGLLLGVIGRRCSAVPNLSLTRLLVMIVTIYAFAIRLEGSIAVEYVVWLRSMAAIGLLHLVFSRPMRAPQIVEDSPAPRQSLADVPFPQLLR